MSVALSTIVDAALAHSQAVGIAVRTVHGDTADSVCRGTVAGVPVAPDTVMYGASVAKQLVAFLLALGVEAGRVGSDDPITGGCPSCRAGSTEFACIISFITPPGCRIWQRRRTGSP